jgi:2-succinyl-5-enolpyruvyl-6-hydroxy-3-cyclohexene-1-carboxylate synthase
LTSHLSNAGKIFQKIASSTLKEIERNRELNMLLNTFNNTKVRSGKRITNTTKHVSDLITWVNERYQKEIDKRKSEKGKTSQTKARDEILSFFSKENKASLKLIFDLQNYIVEAKHMLIKKLAEVGGISTFVQTENGFKVTSPEGFVAIDHLSGSAVKLVDRMEFSKNNFDPSIIKGWQTATRK